MLLYESLLHATVSTSHSYTIARAECRNPAPPDFKRTCKSLNCHNYLCKMSSVKKRICKRVVLILIASSLLTFPVHRTYERSRTSHLLHKHLSSPQSIGCSLLIFVCIVLCFILAFDLTVKAVFVLCRLGIYYATYRNRLQRYSLFSKNIKCL